MKDFSPLHDVLHLHSDQTWNRKGKAQPPPRQQEEKQLFEGWNPSPVFGICQTADQVLWDLTVFWPTWCSLICFEQTEGLDNLDLWGLEVPSKFDYAVILPRSRDDSSI